MRRIILSGLDRFVDIGALVGELVVVWCIVWVLSLPVQYAMHRLIMQHPCVIYVFGRPFAGP